MYNWKRVGQRVKKVRDNGGTVPVGSEGVITGVGPYVQGTTVVCPTCGTTSYCDQTNDFGIAYVNFPCNAERCVFGVWDCMEPIIPDSYKVVEWSSCLWQPSSESINA